MRSNTEYASSTGVWKLKGGRLESDPMRPRRFDIPYLKRNQIHIHPQSTGAGEAPRIGEHAA